MRIISVILLAFIYVNSFAVANSSEKGLSESTVASPKMRVVDRDGSYFKKVPCESIHKIKFCSRSEEVWLAKRKSQCKNKYNAFMSKPVGK